MSHAHARLTVHGRLLIVERSQRGWKHAHIAAAMGVSRKCVARWIARFDVEGGDGLQDRSSRPHRSPSKTAPEVEAQVLAVRTVQRRGQDWIGPEIGVPPRTVSRILRRTRWPTCGSLTR